MSLRHRPQLTDGSASCTRLLVCNDSGTPIQRFEQGERAHFFYEFEVLRDIQVPAGGVELNGADGAVVHGKNTFQTNTDVPRQVGRGSILRFHQWMELLISPGTYTASLGLAQCDPDSYKNYTQGDLPFESFAPNARECCRVIRVVRIEVGSGRHGKLSHHGVADLPGDATLDRVHNSPLRLPDVHSAEPNGRWPTVLHLTHWKAGSQWIYKVLQHCAPERIVPAEMEQEQIRYYPIRPGHLYPTVYMSRDELEGIALPAGVKRFVVIRDLRDTLVSAYYSFKVSHPILHQSNAVFRETLQRSNMEDGMLFLLEGFLGNCARIQLSWLESDDIVLRYEDLLRNDLELLESVLIGHCGIPISRDALRSAVVASRFESITGGRPLGQEDISAHERKGVSGDWSNHFTARLKKAFKARYGGLLVAAGYERDLAW